jgi:hypothetical protein
MENETKEIQQNAFDKEPTKKEQNARLMKIYWIGCAGLCRAAESLGTGKRIDRIGCSVESNLADRLSTAGSDAYASWTRDENGHLAQEPGFTRWVMQAIKTTRVSRNPIITVKTRSFEIQMPDGMTRRTFDSALHRGLKRWSLSSNYPYASRFTNYSVDRDRLSQAIELYVGLDPRSDGNTLLGIVENILDAHVAAIPSTQSRATGVPPSRLPTPKVKLAPSLSGRRLTFSQVAAMRARRNRIITQQKSS